MPNSVTYQRLEYSLLIEKIKKIEEALLVLFQSFFVPNRK